MTRQFRLATVERLRTARMEAGGRELVAANAALKAARDQRTLLMARLHACQDPARTTPENLIALAGRRDRLREQLAAADAELAGLAEAVQQARTAWLRARAELRAVQTLHQRHDQALRQELDRRDRVELDDLAVRVATVTRARLAHLAAAGGQS